MPALQLHVSITGNTPQSLGQPRSDDCEQSFARGKARWVGERGFPFCGARQMRAMETVFEETTWSAVDGRGVVECDTGITAGESSFSQ